ncbi:AAA family ATPase [Candidatus Woesearchaeota archaeon]|nr:AAA family ATPase [Candidatus Woesearchaeota archaeon]
MIIKSLKLNNIRSYLSQEIEFPKGSVLLAGDIGSGKSTILLAIEFALFGTRRKHLSASSLLRHGKKEGEVELSFDLDGKGIIVKRKLKRGKEDIAQEAGYIIVDDKKKEGTAIELKTDILNLLGYPKELVTKSKDIIYRYTVYTPQEEMKQIILEEKDIRLDTLRKVFNIDKYKRIRENSQIFINALKEKKKEDEGRIADLEEKKKQKTAYGKEVKELDSKIDDLKPKLELMKYNVKKNKENISKAEKEIEALNRLKKELALNDLNLKNKLERRKSNKNNLEQLEKQINGIKKEVAEKEKINIEDLFKKTKEKENQIELMEKTSREISKKINEFELESSHSNEIKMKIAQIEQCPLCEQAVGAEHKKRIAEREDKKLAEFKDHLTLHKEQEKNAKNKLNELKNELKKLKEDEFSISVIELKIKNLEEKTRLKDSLLEEQEKIKKEIGKINKDKIEISEKIEKFGAVEKDYRIIKDQFDKILDEEKRLELDINSLEKEKEGINKLMLNLDFEIKTKLKIKENIAYLAETKNWLENYFIGLMGVMEKHIMLQVHREFDELFQRWFSILIEDETLAVRLDDEFSPVIEQNGYETFIENLSGGERTAVALSYRLALNKVINDIISQIKTKDIIMLDEPTDGFSTEQLDKVRDVLDQLNIKQVILVSHENKIESFVDNVIRINKHEHISEINP